MGNKGSQTTTNTSAPNPQAGAAYSQLLTQAGQVASTPYNPYTGELVAPINQQQQTGVGGINQYATAAQPYLQEAGGLATSAAQPINAQAIQNYENPYTSQVVNATEEQFQNTNAQQQQQVLGNAVAQGALGGDRTAVAQAVLAGQQQASEAPVIAGLENTGYNTATQTALAEQQAQAQGAYNVDNVGTSIENAGLSGANAQFGAGTAEQQTQQAEDTAAYQQFEQALAYPFQTEQWLAGIDTGVGSQLGGTSSTTAPPPNPLNAELGLGAAGIGAFGSYAGSAAGSAALTALLARGGAVKHHDTIPENHKTLHAQRQQLIDGHRVVQMYPRGAGELEVPSGMARTSTPHAVFHYDPKRISEKEIHDTAARARENKLIGLGPHSKNDILKRVSGGEHPVAVVERTPDGTEVRAAAGTVDTLHSQIEAMERGKSPGNKIHVESPHETLFRRRHAGGRIPHFDTGGSAGLFNPTQGTPYAGGVGYVPTNTITRGQGAPRPPQVQSPGQMMQNAAGLANAFKPSSGILNAAPMGQSPAVNPPVDLQPGQFKSDVQIYKRGGTVVPIRGGMGMPSFLPRKRFADGGTPYGQDYMDQTFAVPITHTGPNYDIASNPAAMAQYSALASADALAGTGVGPSAAYAQSNPYVPLPRERPVEADASDLPPEIAGSPAPSPGLAYSGAAPQGGLTAPPANIAPAGNDNVPVAPPAPGFLGLSPDFYQSLMAAGLGTAASRSPFVGQAIGEGGLQGLSTYGDLQKQHLAQQKQQQDVDLKVRQLDQQAKAEQDRVAAETKPYDQMTAAQKAEVEFRNRNEQRQEMQPVKIGTDMSTGTDIYAVRDPSVPGGFRRIDPNAGAVPTGTPQGTGAPVSSAAPSPAQPNAAGNAQLPATSTPVAGETPDNVKPEVLATLDPNLASQVKALDEGRMAFPTGFALKSPYWQNILRLVSQYDPSFDAVNYNARAKTRADFVAGKSAQNITSFNTAIGHLDTLDKSIDALGNTNYPWLNPLVQGAKSATGNTEFQASQKQFAAAKQAVTDELTRAFRGSGGNVHDIVGWEQTLNQADSPPALHAAVKAAVDLLRSRIESVGDQYNRGMGTTRDPLTMLSPHAADTVHRLSGDAAAPPAQSGAPVPGAKLYQGKWYTRGPNGEAVPVE